MNPLRHLAIVMDGNGRWATKRGLKRVDGHKKGAEVLKSITEFCASSCCVDYLTFYAFSTENQNRPKLEIDFLMKLLKEYLFKERENYQKHGIRFKAIGDLSFFSPSLYKEIIALEELSANGENLTQILALNYGGKDEIVRACKSLLKEQKEINENNLQNALDTSFCPNVDMFLRTGGEKRLSNFLLWQSSYAELFFSDTLWPDFSTKELSIYIQEFYKRERRFGGI